MDEKMSAMKSHSCCQDKLETQRKYLRKLHPPLLSKARSIYLSSLLLAVLAVMLYISILCYVSMLWTDNSQTKEMKSH